MKWDLFEKRIGMRVSLLSFFKHVFGYFGVSRARPVIRAYERVLGASGSGRSALFDGRWALEWGDHVSISRRVLDLPPNTDMKSFTSYMVSVRAFLRVGASVIVNPSHVKAALSSVVSLRYVGLLRHEPVTTAEFAKPGCDRQLWELLRSFEYGVSLGPDVLFLPFLYTLREMTVPDPTPPVPDLGSSSGGGSWFLDFRGGRSARSCIPCLLRRSSGRPSASQ